MLVLVVLIFLGNSCWSYVGKSYKKNNDFQELSLGPGCRHGGTIMHEMMHAVGFWHEQSRPDRNQYVEVFWENIKKGGNTGNIL